MKSVVPKKAAALLLVCCILAEMDKEGKKNG